MKQIKIDDFESIFHQYKNWIYKTAYLIVRDHQKAEDIMQEVFISAYKSNDTYDPEKGSYRNWLRTITVNQCFNRTDKRALPLFSVEELEERGQSIPDSGIPFPETISLKDDMQRLLSSLSEKYRAALLLRYYEGLSYDEIAEVLNVPLGTVKSRINAAVLKLRERQKKQEDKSRP